MSAQRKAVAPVLAGRDGKGQPCERPHDSQIPNLRQGRPLITAVPTLQTWAIKVLLPLESAEMGNYPDRSAALCAAKAFAELCGGKVLP